ncbi:uncharacterized protein K452DRAFT_196747, partial [Aplosporella prunicola CBS 121167]
PDHVRGHLQGKHHKFTRADAVVAAEEVKARPGLIPFASELQIPTQASQPIPHLPL